MLHRICLEIGLQNSQCYVKEITSHDSVYALLSVCMSLTPPYVGVVRASRIVDVLRPAYVTAPTSCSLERCPLCVRDSTTSQMIQTCYQLRGLRCTHR